VKSAMVIGITGQDGGYLAELLLERNYRVIGVTWRAEEEARESLPSAIAARVELAMWDMLDGTAIERVLHDYRPAEVFNCAAFSSGSGMFDDPVKIGLVNGIAVTRILEGIRAVDAEIRFCQASSSEVFAEASESPQNEHTPRAPRSPYGAAKCYADDMVRCYRTHFGLFACSAILFNHESPRRGSAFVTRKIAREVARISLGVGSELPLGNLSAARDWGFAGDSVRAMWLMLQADSADDFVIATGESHTVRDFCELAFRHVGLDYNDHVREDPAEFRPAEPRRLVGDSRKARRELNWQPTVSFEGLVALMVDAELQGQRRS